MPREPRLWHSAPPPDLRKGRGGEGWPGQKWVRLGQPGAQGTGGLGTHPVTHLELGPSMPAAGKQMGWGLGSTPTQACGHLWAQETQVSPQLIVKQIPMSQFMPSMTCGHLGAGQCWEHGALAGGEGAKDINGAHRAAGAIRGCAGRRFRRPGERPTGADIRLMLGRVANISEGQSAFITDSHSPRLINHRDSISLHPSIPAISAATRRAEPALSPPAALLIP